jgi:cell division transport system permease protein
MSRDRTAKRPKLAREGAGGRLRYFLERAVLNIRQNILVNVLTVATISLAFLILSLFLLLYVNLERVTESWSDRVQIAAYFDRELAPGEVKALTGKIRAIEGTSGVTYISRQEALKRFSVRLKGQESLLNGVTSEILPSSLEIHLKRNSRDSDSITAYVSRLKRISEITEVQYGEEWVQRFTDFMNLIRFTGALVGGFLVLAVVFIVANTIKLTIFSRKDELELMGLVGATRWFIKAPFLIEGVLQGLLGVSLAIFVLFGVYMVFLHNADIFFSFHPMVSGLLFLPLPYLATLLLGGAALGFLGSLASLKRFISL